MASWSDDAARNRELWTKSNADYTDRQARDRWAGEPAWGMWDIPEGELGGLGDDERVDDRLHRRQFGMHRFEWPDGGTEFHLAHGEWIDVLCANGFEIERLIELQAPEHAVGHEYYDYVTAEWAKRWPAEEIWVV